MQSNKTETPQKWIGTFSRAALVLLAVSILLAAVTLAFRYALPFLIAIALALLLNPVVAFVARKTGLPRGLASFVVLFAFFSVAIGLMLGLALALIRGITSLTKDMPDHLGALIGDLQTFFFAKLLPSWEQAAHIFSGITEGQQKAVQLNLESMVATLMNFLNDLITRTLQSLTQFVGSLPNTLLSAAFIFLASFFISKDANVLKARLSKWLIPMLRQPLSRVFQELKRTSVGFVRAQFLLVLLTMLTISIGLLILHTGHAFIIALFAGLVDLIPYLGTGVIFIPWIIFQILQHHYSLALALTSLYLAVVIQRQLLEPKILSQAIGLDPLVALISLYFGFRWLGFSGLVIGPLTVVVLKALYQTGTLAMIWRYIKEGNG